MWPRARLEQCGLETNLAKLEHTGFDDPAVQAEDERRICGRCSAYKQASWLSDLSEEFYAEAHRIRKRITEVCYWCVKEGKVLGSKCEHTQADTTIEHDEDWL